jgi:cyclophilin family peptidyl-prolyl cis-trans isomerase/HEAT repeat protein
MTRAHRSTSFVLAALGALALAAAPACKTTPPRTAEQAAADPLVILGRLEQERAAATSIAKYLDAVAFPDAAVRAKAALVLARLEHTATEPLLEKALADGDASVRAAAAFGLGQLDLALDPKFSAHQLVRNAAEKRLIAALSTERDVEARRAIVRALGRVADGAGLDALVSLAGGKDPLRADALLALGVSGARRKASHTNDAALLTAVSSALVDGDDAARTAAAYAAFRQKLKLPVDAVKAGLSSADAQTRIFLVRAAGSQDDAVGNLVVGRGLKDKDWRVVSEALKASGTRAQLLADVSAVVDDAAARLARGESGSLGHVVREGCTALAASGAGPAQVKATLQKALVTLVPTGKHAAAACACAVALDVVDPAGKAVERCDVDADQSEIDRWRVAAIAMSRVSSSEKVAALAPFLKRDDTKTRMAAAGALADDGGPDAARAAAERLVDELDFGVASTLLSLFADNEDNRAALTDSVLYKLAERFREGSSFEQVEPLVTVIDIALSRDTPTARTIVTELSSHPEPRVRDAAKRVLPGDRDPGPRASVLAAPPASTLPLHAVLKTSRGDVRIQFDREHAASTVANFAALARARFYDGTPFHRVIADFVAQGGDKRGDGAGGPGYTIACENSDEPFTRGAVGIATAGKDTGGSQFFFTHSFQPHLDGRYTLFARVVDGQDVVDALQPDDVLLSVDFLGAAPPR